MRLVVCPLGSPLNLSEKDTFLELSSRSHPRHYYFYFTASVAGGRRPFQRGTPAPPPAWGRTLRRAGRGADTSGARASGGLCGGLGVKGSRRGRVRGRGPPAPTLPPCNGSPPLPSPLGAPAGTTPRARRAAAPGGVRGRSARPKALRAPTPSNLGSHPHPRPTSRPPSRLSPSERGIEAIGVPAPPPANESTSQANASPHPRKRRKSRVSSPPPSFQRLFGGSGRRAASAPAGPRP